MFVAGGEGRWSWSSMALLLRTRTYSWLEWWGVVGSNYPKEQQRGLEGCLSTGKGRDKTVL